MGETVGYTVLVDEVRRTKAVVIKCDYCQNSTSCKNISIAAHTVDLLLVVLLVLWTIFNASGSLGCAEIQRQAVWADRPVTNWRTEAKSSSGCQKRERTGTRG